MRKVLKDITAQNQFSDALQIYGSMRMFAYDTSSMSMTVTLQVKVDGNWFSTGKTLTAEGSELLEEGQGLEYRVGVATGDFTSGTATIYLVTGGR